MSRTGRAQRLSASQRSAPRYSVLGRSDLSMCSTPFGITEVGTDEPPVLKNVEFMLNAFRHHRGRHNLHPAGRRVLIGCSTPFGITEVGTRLLAFGKQSPERCSTPFGITEVGTRVALDRRAVPRMLNAFRHHRGRHSRNSTGSLASADAQRLSASQRSARHPLTFASCILECSTPFGITEVGTSERLPVVREAGHAQRLSASQRSARPGYKSLGRGGVGAGFSRGGSAEWCGP